MSRLLEAMNRPGAQTPLASRTQEFREIVAELRASRPAIERSGEFRTWAQRVVALRPSVDQRQAERANRFHFLRTLCREQAVGRGGIGPAETIELAQLEAEQEAQRELMRLIGEAESKLCEAVPVAMAQRQTELQRTINFLGTSPPHLLREALEAFAREFHELAHLATTAGWDELCKKFKPASVQHVEPASTPDATKPAKKAKCRRELEPEMVGPSEEATRFAINRR